MAKVMMLRITSIGSGLVNASMQKKINSILNSRCVFAVTWLSTLTKTGLTIYSVIPKSNRLSSKEKFMLWLRMMYSINLAHGRRLRPMVRMWLIPSMMINNMVHSTRTTSIRTMATSMYVSFPVVKHFLMELRKLSSRIVLFSKIPVSGDGSNMKRISIWIISMKTDRCPNCLAIGMRTDHWRSRLPIWRISPKILVI